MLPEHAVHAAEKVLWQNQLKVTLTRVLILMILLEENRHFTVDAIIKEVWGRYPNSKTSSSGIYGCLRKLAEAGVVQRRSFDRKLTYSHTGLCGDNDQLVEVASGRVFDLNHETLKQAKAQIAREVGFCAEKCRIELRVYANEPVRSHAQTESENQRIDSL